MSTFFDLFLVVFNGVQFIIRNLFSSQLFVKFCFENSNEMKRGGRCVSLFLEVRPEELGRAENTLP